MTDQNVGGASSGENPAPAIQIVPSADAPSDAISVQNAAELLTNARRKAAEPQKRAPKAQPVQAEPEPDTDDEAGADTGDASDEIDLDADSDADADEATPDRIPAPKSWSEADASAWNELTPAAQRKWLDRERQMKSGYDKQLSKQANEHKARMEAVAAQEAQITTHRQQLETALGNTQAGIINRLSTEFADVDPRNPASLAKLAGDDPGRKVLFDELWKQLGAIGYQAKQIEARRHEESQAELDKFAAERANKLLELKPDLADPVVQKAFESEVVEYLHGQRKIDPQRINMYDADELIMAHESMLYRKAVAARKAKQAAPTNSASTSVVRAGQPRDSGKSERVSVLENKAKKSGRVDDVLALYKATRKAG